jgi:hypothetical protein
VAVFEEIVIDAEHPASLARFWAAALDSYAVRPYDAEEIARLAARGLDPETDPSVAVDGDGPTLFFQQTERRTERRNRIHFDLGCDDRVVEIERLLGLGARIREHRDDYTVMLDPEGNQFCVKERK